MIDGEDIAPTHHLRRLPSPSQLPPPSSPPPQLKPNNVIATATVMNQKRIVTLPLLRKRSEHNEGLVSTLEELALHQEDLQSIGPILGRTCGKTLKILLMQNNVIERMDPSELKLFRSLEYLNLALNNISKVEGIGGMESLRKLDLTLNFVDVDALEESVDEMSDCPSLEELYLLGNPCIGLDNGGDPDGDVANADTSVEGSEAQNQTSSPPPPMINSQKHFGWKGCRAYIVARLPNLQFLDGKEIKRSERIVATQKLPSLTAELRFLAEAREKERQVQKKRNQQQDNSDEEAVDNEFHYLSDDGPTHHNPETRTKISNELYDQKRAKEKMETANHAPHPKGEKEWEEEHKNMVQQVRAREERDRESEKNNVNADLNNKRGDGHVKQCNQGKYHFWFDEEAGCIKDDEDGVRNKRSGNLIMRIAIPKHLSTSLIDVDIHPNYVSIVIKSKILRVLLPVEIHCTQSRARRSAASGYLELIMPKVNPIITAIGLGLIFDGKENRRAMDEAVGSSDFNERGATAVCKAIARQDNRIQKNKRERLAQSIMKEVKKVHSLTIVRDQATKDCLLDDDDDSPPPLI